MDPDERFAQRVFFWAAVYGLLALVPQYFLEAYSGRLFPPPVNHPEHFYGFLGVAVAWQLAFLAIAREPARLRPVMLPAVMEKWLFCGAGVVLIALGRAPAALAPFAAVDGALGLLFLLSHRRLR